MERTVGGSRKVRPEKRSFSDAHPTGALHGLEVDFISKRIISHHPLDFIYVSCCLETNQLPETSPAEMGLFGISR